jgi:hypothetical protein
MGDGGVEDVDGRRFGHPVTVVEGRGAWTHVNSEGSDDQEPVCWI